MPKNKQPFDYRQSAGIYLGNGVKASGHLRVSDDIVIDGDFSGEITTSGFCEIAESGQVEADVNAHSFTIYGHYKGHCRADGSIIVKNTSYIDGYLTSNTITIEPGAAVRARIKPLENGA